MFYNFIFDGVSNNTYDIQCCSFDSNSGLSSISDGSQSELNTEKSPMSNKWYLYEMNYSEPITFKIQIVNKDYKDMPVDKRRAITKWLCRNNTYSWLSIDKEGYHDINFNVVIHSPKVLTISGSIGMEFDVVCDSPFGYSNPRKITALINKSNQLLNIYNDSDEIGYIYPRLSIVMTNGGNLSITNNNDINRHVFYINNTTAGETITLDNELKIIETNSLSHRNILADFSKRWFRIAEGENEYVVNGNCYIEIEYREIRKVGVEI